jgi:hypothetical protein
MMSDGYTDFFGVMTGSGATLTGIIFVGLSMRRGPSIVESPRDLGDKPTEEALGDAILMASLGGFIVSSLAMLPAVPIGYVALPIDGVLLVLLIRGIVRLLRMRANDPARERWIFRIGALSPLVLGAAVVACQIWAAALLIADPHGLAGLFRLAVSIVGYYGYVLLRSWMLIGGARTGLRSVFDPISVANRRAGPEERGPRESS